MAYNSPYKPTSLTSLSKTIAESMEPLTALKQALSASIFPKLAQPSAYLPDAQFIQRAQTRFQASHSLYIVGVPSSGKSSLFPVSAAAAMEDYTAAADAARRFFEQERLFSRSFRLHSLDISFASELAETAVRELGELRNRAVHSIDQLIEGVTSAELTALDYINLGLVESLEGYYKLAERLEDERHEFGWIIRLLERLKNNVNETWTVVVRLRRALKNKSSLINCSCTALSRFARRTRAMLLTCQLKPTYLPNGRLFSVFEHLRGYLTQLHSPVTSTFSRCYFPSPSFSQNVAVSGLIIQWLRKLRRNDSI